jgi:hypothetical protein
MISPADRRRIQNVAKARFGLYVKMIRPRMPRDVDPRKAARTLRYYTRFYRAQAPKGGW